MKICFFSYFSYIPSYTKSKKIAMFFCTPAITFCTLFTNARNPDASVKYSQELNKKTNISTAFLYAKAENQPVFSPRSAKNRQKS